LLHGQTIQDMPMHTKWCDVRERLYLKWKMTNEKKWKKHDKNCKKLYKWKVKIERKNLTKWKKQLKTFLKMAAIILFLLGDISRYIPLWRDVRGRHIEILLHEHVTWMAFTEIHEITNCPIYVAYYDPKSDCSKDQDTQGKSQQTYPLSHISSFSPFYVWLPSL
jgi:hypothetical protein